MLACVCLILHSLVKNIIVTAGAGVVGALALGAVYLTNQSAFEGSLPAMLSVFSVRSVLTNFASYSVFDVRGLLLYLSIIFVFLLLSVHPLQKRRFS